MSAGIKNDCGKDKVGLIDREALIQLAKVLDCGKHKYAVHNWRKGIEWQRIIDSALRHILAFNDAEDMDPESGLNHIAHAMCNCMFLLNYYKNHPELDNRYHKEKSPELASGAHDYMYDRTYTTQVVTKSPYLPLLPEDEGQSINPSLPVSKDSTSGLPVGHRYQASGDRPILPPFGEWCLSFGPKECKR